MNLTVCIVPAKVLTDGTHKVRIAISHNSETRYYVTRFRIPSPKNLKNGRVTGKDVTNAEYINLQLGGIIQKMYKAYDAIPNADCYTCSQLLRLIESRMSRIVPVTFEDIASEWLSLRESVIAKDSTKLFKRGIACFIEFVGSGFLLSELDPKTVDEYNNHLLNSNARTRQLNEMKEKKKLSHVTANTRIGILKMIVRYAEKKKYVYYEVDPFVNYTSKPLTPRDAWLECEELRKVRDYKTKDIDVSICRDIFMLSFYLCGINLGDMMSLDYRNDYISFIRIKTQRSRTDGLKTTFTIQPEAREIIARYIGKDGKLHFKQFKKKENVENFVQRNLKKIETELDMKKHIVYYSARKTFSQIGYLLRIQDRVLKFCIGDSINASNSDILSFYTKINRQMADEAIRSVLDFVASNKTEEDLFIQDHKEH